MEHNLFKPRSLDEGKHAVVGDCNGYSMNERWEQETPLFAQAILKRTNTTSPHILDYGCGVGRLAKEILTQDSTSSVVGLDASRDMLVQATNYINDARFTTVHSSELIGYDKFDLVYCVYVLQHCPAIEMRDALAKIHYNLKDDGLFVYCSSDYRMAIRYDNGGFFDDRFLGVNIREEISRFFEPVENLFSDEELLQNSVVKNMVQGSLPHPAIVYKKKPIQNYFEAKADTTKAESAITTTEVKVEVVERPVSEARKLLLVNRLAPGDILVMTNAIRDLHLAHPDKYLTNVRTPCPQIFENNPYITNFAFDENKYTTAHAKMEKESGHYTWIDDVLAIDMHYPLIHRSGEVGSHFSEGHREFLENVLNIKIPQTYLTPSWFLSQTERDWASPVTVKHGLEGKYWVINAGSKGDYTLKQYPYYQDVVNLLKDKITFVQIGEKSHNHKPLEGVISMLGETNVRELSRLIYKSEGVITCVSFPMHLAAAFRKPCVVVAGAREGTRWELYPNHQFLYVNGCLPCATYDGCWKSKFEDCKNKVEDIPRCMTLITPNDVARAVTRYYEGAMLTY